MVEPDIKLGLDDLVKCKVIKNNASYRLGMDRDDVLTHGLDPGDCVWVGIVKVTKKNGKQR